MPINEPPIANRIVVARPVPVSQEERSKAVEGTHQRYMGKSGHLLATEVCTSKEGNASEQVFFANEQWWRSRSPPKTSISNDAIATNS